MNNLTNKIKILNNNFIFNFRQYSSKKSPLQENEAKIKKEFESHRNSVNIINFSLPQYVENLKKNITPSLLEKSTEHVLNISDFTKFRKFSFNNRTDAIKFYIEANKYINIVKDDYKKEATSLLQQMNKIKEKERLDYIKNLYKSKTPKTSFIKKLAYVNDPSASIKITNIDPLYHVSKESIHALPEPNLNLDIQVVELKDNLESGIRSLLNGKLPREIKQTDNIILGFDCDWSALSKYLTGNNSKVSIISLSNGEKTVLFRICNFGLNQDDLLGELLQNKNIVKTGVRVHKDSNKIMKDFGFLPENITDLSYDKKASIALGTTPNAISIEKLAAILFKVNISRSRTLKLSNWASSQGLTKDQINSVAYNSYYAYKTHFKLPELPSDLESSI